MSAEEGAWLALAQKLADEARRMTLRDFRRNQPVEDKNRGGRGGAKKAALKESFDPITKADREVEAYLRREIARHFPSHRVWGEEEGRFGSPASPVEWILDPIDGTRNYVAGALYWTVLIGARHEGRARIGLCDHPLTEERFFASRQEGAWFEDRGGKRALKTRPCASLSEAILGATTPALFQSEKERESFDRIGSLAKMVLFGGNSYFYGLVAAGQMDAVVESSLTVFDVQPLIPIVEEAGGVMTDWRGEPLREGGQVLACGDARLHATILPFLKEAAS